MFLLYCLDCTVSAWDASNEDYWLLGILWIWLGWGYCMGEYQWFFAFGKILLTLLGFWSYSLWVWVTWLKGHGLMSLGWPSISTAITQSSMWSHPSILWPCPKLDWHWSFPFMPIFLNWMPVSRRASLSHHWIASCLYKAFFPMWRSQPMTFLFNSTLIWIMSLS